jgi:hypothetical protein
MLRLRTTSTATNTIDMENLYKKFLVSRMFIDKGFPAFVVPWGLSQKRQRE